MRTLVLSLLAVAVTPAFAQRHGGGHYGSGSSYGGGGFGRRGGFPGGGFHGGQGGYRSGASYSGGAWNDHLPTHRVYRPSRPVRVYNRTNVYERNVYRPNVVVRPYRASEWRARNPGWHERYYWHGGNYYYDNAYRYPAVIDNEWGSIAALSGGIALAGAFNHDPYLTFGGAAGALYALSRYDSDLRSTNPQYRLRASYFNRPYFWRSGVRYDRSLVTVGGTRYYRFHRHV